MGLNFTQKTETIKFDGGDITLRGLTFPDISILVDTHRETAMDLYDRFTGRDPNAITTADASDLAMVLVTTVPSIVATVIALSADCMDRIGDVFKLPIDVQVAALEKIAIMTFAMAGGTKNFLETIVRLASQTNGVVADLKTVKPLN